MTAFLKQELEDGGFVVNEIVTDIIDNLPEEDWFIEYTQNLKRFCLEKFGRDDVDNLVAEGKFEVTHGWQDKNYNLENEVVTHSIIEKLSHFVKLVDPSLEASGLKTLQRMQEGIQLKAHTDQDTDPSIRYATIIYINDNYNGGELFFTNKDIEIKPKAGSLIVFPGTNEFNHGVRHVQAGPIRYVLVGFIKVVDFYKNNKY